MATKLITAPAVEPVTLAEARAHLKATSADEDVLIQGWIMAARERAESFTARRLITQTWDWVMDRFPCWEMEVPNAPLQSVTSISYVDTAGATQVLDAAKYLVDAKSDPGRITPAYGEVWPPTRSQINAVTVRFVCGYGLANAVPVGVKAAMLLVCGYLDQHREDVTDFEKFQLPQNSEWLMRPYRVMRF